jgi:hypothetical protein
MIATLFGPAGIYRGNNLLYLEDDIAPCFNGYRYMLDWRGPKMPATERGPRMTSFYNPYRKADAWHTGFIFSQALMMPAQLVARMASEPYPPPHPQLQLDGIDSAIHRYLTRWKLPFYQHRSVVQHVGGVSTWTPSTLAGGGRTAIDWPGTDADAYSIFRP